MYTVVECTKLKYSRLSLSRIPRDSLKYFEISEPRHIRFAELRKKNRTTTFNKYICYWTLEIRDILKNIVEKRRNCSLGAISPLFYNIFLPVVSFLCLGRDQISLRDKRLFEISEVEITRVNCVFKLKTGSNEPRLTSHRCWVNDVSLFSDWHQSCVIIWVAPCKKVSSGICGQ